MEKTFAVLNNNVVVNVIVAESKEVAEQVVGLPCVEYTNQNSAAIGDTYDEVNNVFVTPTPALEG